MTDEVMPAEEEAAPAAAPATMPDVPGWVRLDEAAGFIKRFVVLPSPAYADMLAVWAMGTHVYKAFEKFPRIAFQSLEPASGKSLALKLTMLMSFKARIYTSYTAALLSRLANQGGTLGLDEADTIFRTTRSNAPLQAVLNDGFDSKGKNAQCSGSEGIIERSVFCPIGLASLLPLPPAVASRTITVPMRPRKPEEQADSYFSKSHDSHGEAIGASLGSWAMTYALEISDAWPDLPKGVADREADKWWPFFAIADTVGNGWPERIAAACMEITKGVAAEPDTPPVVRLLADIRSVFIGERMRSSVLVSRLQAIEGAPWASRWSVVSATTELAAMLRSVGVSPRKMRVEGKPVQAYSRSDLEPAWTHYVPSEQVA